MSSDQLRNIILLSIMLYLFLCFICAKQIFFAGDVLLIFSSSNIYTYFQPFLVRFMGKSKCIDNTFKLYKFNKSICKIKVLIYPTDNCEKSLYL